VVPEIVPPPGLVPMAMAMLALLEVTTLLLASSTETVMAGLIVAAATVLVGWAVKTSWLARPAVMLKVPLVAAARPLLVADKVYPVPALLIERSLKVATPLMALTGVVPEIVPPPGLVPMAMAMLALLVVTRLLLASST